MAKSSIALTIAVLAVLGYVGLWIASLFYDLGGFTPNIFVFLIMMGVLFYVIIWILKQSRVGTLDLDKVLLPVLVGVGIVYLLFKYPALIPSNFKTAFSVMSTQIAENAPGLASIILP